MKILSAYTYEIDDVDLAVDEILSMLDLQNNLCQNSVGIVTCYSEFIDTGVVGELSKRLPFDIVGCTTLAGATNKNNGLMMLNISVITGDDIGFATATVHLSDAQTWEDNVEKSYKNAILAITEHPKMIIPFIPINSEVHAETVMSKLDELSAGVPIFGTVACDHNSDSRDAAVIHGDKSYKDTMAMVVVFGNISPQFITVSVSEKKLQKQKAVITKSFENKLYEVNNMPIEEYLINIGLSTTQSMEGISSVPFMLDYNDGSPPVARGIYYLDTDGSAVCAGKIPVGATLYTGSVDYPDVLETTKSVMQDIKEIKGKNGLLIFICMSRCKALGIDSLAELRTLCDYIEDDVPCHVCYSGGELSPVKNSDGKWINRAHNFSFIACVFNQNRMV